MCITEYNEELHEKTLREQGRLEGILEGEKNANKKAIRKMIKLGKTKESILEIYSLEDYEDALKNDNV